MSIVDISHEFFEYVTVKYIYYFIIMKSDFIHSSTKNITILQIMCTLYKGNTWGKKLVAANFKVLVRTVCSKRFILFFFFCFADKFNLTDVNILYSG